jgi:hypothetical protein
MAQKQISKSISLSKPRQKRVKPEETKMAATVSDPSFNSPAWGTNTKLVTALTIVVIIGALLVKFEFILSPLLIALLFAYLFHPIAGFLQRKLHFSWNASVAVIYLVILILLFGLLALGGVGLVQQVQSLVTIVQDAITTLPQLIASISSKVYQFGPFKVDFSAALDLKALSSQVLGVVQPLLSRTGNLVGTLAGSAANFLGWTFFVILVSYFVLAESGGLRGQLVPMDVPGYTHDFESAFPVNWADDHLLSRCLRVFHCAQRVGCALRHQPGIPGGACALCSLRWTRHQLDSAGACFLFSSIQTIRTLAFFLHSARPDHRAYH